MNVSDLRIEWSKRTYAGGPASDSYSAVRCTNHPHVWKNGYIYEHRILVELSLGRFLEKNEIVHHKNENKRDNSLDNLEIISRSAHTALHNVGVTFRELVCPHCNTTFKRELRQLHKKSQRTFCSRSCSARYYHGLRKDR